jgi:hypothetical protein
MLNKMVYRVRSSPNDIKKCVRYIVSVKAIRAHKINRSQKKH